MNQQLYELLQQCTVPIAGKTGHGTGFFVAPSLILTCAHVVASARRDSTSIEIDWNGHRLPARVEVLLPDLDLALLRTTVTEHPCVYLQKEVIPFDNLYSFGYPDDHPVGDSATFAVEGRGGDQGGQLKFKAGQVRPGMSGAPILNIRTGHVCGIVQLTRNRANDLGGRAIPTSKVFQAFPELEEQQQLYHQRDKRWMSCLEEVIARTKYLQGIYRECSFITLPFSAADSFSLQAIFQPLKLRHDPITSPISKREERRTARDGRALGTNVVSAPGAVSVEVYNPVVVVDNSDEALVKSPRNRIVILGGPGTGKTTTLKYLVSVRAREALADLTAPVPILISLPDFARSGSTLRRYLAEHVASNAGVEDDYADLLWKTIENGQAFLCLDGLDEVAPRQRTKVIELINARASVPGNTWIVGSRFTEYKGGQFKRGEFTEWELLPLNHTLRLEIVQGLLPELHRLLHTRYDTTILPGTFIDRVEAHPQAAEWSQNPLLLSLAALVFVQTGSLPSSRATLYREVVEAVVAMREPDELWSTLLIRILEDLSLWLHQSKGRTFTNADLLAFLSDVQGRPASEVPELARRIVNSGVFDIVSSTTYGFRHQAFQEYLAGAELARRLVSPDTTTREKAWNYAWSKRTFSRWIEILRLMIGALLQEPGKIGQQQARRWLHMLIGQRVEGAGDPGNLGLTLAIKSLSEVTGSSDWNDAEGSKLEEEIVSTWVSEMLNAARHNRAVLSNRLEAQAFAVGHLNERAIQIAINLLGAAIDDRDVEAGLIPIAGVNGRPLDYHALYWSPDTPFDPVQGTRAIAVRALGALGQSVPIELLFRALYDKNQSVSSAAASALGKQGERVPLEPLLEALHSDDRDIRLAAVQALGDLGERVPLEPLLEALQNERGNLRSAIVRALGTRERLPLDQLFALMDDEDLMVHAAVVDVLTKQGNHLPLEPLIGALRVDNWRIRCTAVEILGGLGSRVPLEPLLTALHDDDRDVVGAAIVALGAQGNRAPLEQLLRFLHHRDERIRWAVVRAMALQGDHAPLEPLLTALNDEDEYVRRAAAHALRGISERVPLQPLLTALEDESKDVRRAVAKVLGVLGDYVPDQLLASISERDWRAFCAAIEILGALGEYAPLEPLVASLKHENGHVRLAAVWALAAQGARAPLEALITMSQDSSSRVRTATVYALGILGARVLPHSFVSGLHPYLGEMYDIVLKAWGLQKEQVSLEPFLAALYDDDWFVRRAAGWALGAQGERAPLEPLLAALYYADGEMRSAIIEALAASGKPLPLAIFHAALRDENSNVRRLAAEIWGAQGELFPLEPLFAALKDKTWNVVEAVVMALGAQRERVPLQPLFAALHHENWEVRRVAVAALGALGERVPLEPLLAALNDEEYSVRWVAVEALGAQGQRAPLEPLLAALHDEQDNVRRVAIEALGAQGQRAPLEPLLAALHDESFGVRRSAVAALGALGERVPLEPLLAALHDQVGNVRMMAVRVLGTRRQHVPLEPFLEALYDEDKDVRKVTVQVLGALGKRVPFEILVATLGDEDKDVRIVAIQILRKLYPEALSAVTSMAVTVSWNKVTTDEVSGMGQDSPVLVEKPTQLLSWPHWQVRMRAARALGKLRRNIPDKALHELLEMRRDPDPSMQYVQEAAYNSSRSEISPDVLGTLTQGYIADVIGDMGQASAVLLEKLTQLLNWPHWQVRVKAAQALGKLRRNIPDKALHELLEMRRDPDPSMRYVRQAADDALAEILSLETGIEDDD